MKTTMHHAHRFAGGFILAAAVLLAGCASDGSGGFFGSGTSVTASDPTRFTKSGFLSNYDRLRKVDFSDGTECWRDPKVDLKKFDKVMVSRIGVTLKPRDGKDQTIDPNDLKTLTDYLYNSLTRALKPQMAIANKAEPGVVVIRIALTSLVPTEVSRSVIGTLTPYGFVAEAGSGVATGRPAGSTPYLGETGMEMQFLDGGSGVILAECRDTEIGRKYASDVNAGTAGAAETWADGYLNSFQAWTYAKNAFDKWSLLIAQRFAELRGVKPAPAANPKPKT